MSDVNESPAPEETNESGEESKLTLNQLTSDPTKLLGIGLALVLLTFAIKVLLIDMAGTTLPTYLTIPKLMAKQQVEIAEYELESDKLERKISTLRRKSFDAEPKEQKEITEQIDKLKEKRDKIVEKNKDKIDDIREEYDEKLFKARRKLAKASASGLGWLQMGIWMKILLDVPRILGCLLIVFATFQLVVDPKASSHLKSFAIVCSTVVLLMATAWSVVAMLS